MQKILTKPAEQTQASKAIYIVVTANMEYNDEYYYQEGWNKPETNAFSTLQEAQAARGDILKDYLSDFHLEDLNAEEFGADTAYMSDDIYNDYWIPYGEDASKAWVEIQKAANPDKKYISFYANPYTKFQGFIEWCEQNGKDWTKYVPGSLISIQQVTLI